MLFFEAWANLFLFFVYETRFFFVCFCFVKLRQTAGIVNDMTCATVLASLSKHALAGTAEGEGLVGPRPHHFFAPPPPLFVLKRKIIKIKKKT